MKIRKIKAVKEKESRINDNADLYSSDNSDTSISKPYQSQKVIDKVKQGLKACKGESGFFNPTMAFDCLNDIVRKENPIAYQPEVDKIISAKILRDKTENTKKCEAQEHEKALFDFDEEIDDLEHVENRYPNPEPKENPINKRLQ